jgi:hypothetical protein
MTSCRCLSRSAMEVGSRLRSNPSDRARSASSSRCWWAKTRRLCTASPNSRMASQSVASSTSTPSTDNTGS